jgi:hypothetical protein
MLKHQGGNPDGPMVHRGGPGGYSALTRERREQSNTELPGPRFIPSTG